MTARTPVNDPRGAFESELSIIGAGPTTWRLTSPLIWTGTQGDTFTVPIGFTTDFATVPRFLHWLVSPYGAYTRAAVLHDWLLVELAEWWAKYRDGRNPDMALPPNLPPANSRDADGIFRRVMEDLGVPRPTRWAMWAAVRLAALFNRRRAYGRGFAKDAPKVISIALLAAPLTIVGVVGVLFSLGLVRLVGAADRALMKQGPEEPVTKEEK
jgi:uncharacterized protein DUF1353